MEVAKVMVKKPEILVVDETTTALSQKGRELLYQLMESLKKEGKAVIFISHDLDEIKQVCDTLTVLRDGKIITHFMKLTRSKLFSLRQLLKQVGKATDILF